MNVETVVALSKAIQSQKQVLANLKAAREELESPQDLSKSEFVGMMSVMFVVFCVIVFKMLGGTI